LRLGLIDVIVGINLLREGLDIPEVSLVAIFDADRQGFLRNERSLLQTIGRAARNEDGAVLLYADGISPSMEAAIRQTLERRARQMAYNEAHGIVPRTIVKALPSLGQESEGLFEGTTSSMGGRRRLVAKRGGRQEGALQGVGAELLAAASEPENPIEKSNSQLDFDDADLEPSSLNDLAVEVRSAMEDAARALDFEEAARLRDRLMAIEDRISSSGD